MSKQLNNIMLSIILPFYNEVKDLPCCLRAIEAQDYSNYEVIAVNDGSTDKSADITSVFIDNHPNLNIRLINSDHRGPGAARNKGARLAKGEILVFIDADVIVKPDYLERITEEIRNKHTIGTMYGYEENINYNKNLWTKCYGRIRWNAYGEGRKTYPVFSAILKSEYDRVGGYDEKRGYGEDHTIYYKIGMPAKIVNVTSYHRNPSTVKESFLHFLWWGKGIPQRLLDSGDETLRKKTIAFILLLPVAILITLRLLSAYNLYIIFILYFSLFVTYILIRSMSKDIQEKEIRMIFVYPIFLSLQCVANIMGSLGYLILKKHWK